MLPDWSKHEWMAVPEQMKLLAISTQYLPCFLGKNTQKTSKTCRIITGKIISTNRWINFISKIIFNEFQYRNSQLGTRSESPKLVVLRTQCTTGGQILQNWDFHICIWTECKLSLCFGVNIINSLIFKIFDDFHWGFYFMTTAVRFHSKCWRLVIINFLVIIALCELGKQCIIIKWLGKLNLHPCQECLCNMGHLLWGLINGFNHQFVLNQINSISTPCLTSHQMLSDSGSHIVLVIGKHFEIYLCFLAFKSI